MQRRRDMLPAISRNRKTRATALALVLALAGCGLRGAQAPADPTATPLSPPLGLGRAFVLESWGAPPEDTTVVFRPEEDRVIVLRRGAPDNNLFARLSFPAGSIVPRTGDVVRLTIRPRPGLYGIDLLTDAAFRDGGQITFSYAIHFVPPSGASEAYGSPFRFERFLGVARQDRDSILVFLDSWRPASDVLTARIREPGRYLVAAPREAPRFRSIIW